MVLTISSALADVETRLLLAAEIRIFGRVVLHGVELILDNYAGFEGGFFLVTLVPQKSILI